MAEIAPLADPLNGHCLCRKVTIELSRPKPLVDVCHCEMCRRWGGSFFGGIGGESFSIEGQSEITVFRSSEWAERAFCSICGSNLYFHFLPAKTQSFLVGLFDLPEDFKIEQQIFYDEKPGWYDLAQRTPCKTGAEIIAEAEAAGFTFD